MKFANNIKWALFIFLLTYIPIWYNLDKPALYIWDEASYAVNALEMAIHKNFFVLKTDGETTLYNVKPPLVIWLQCASIWLFGPNELAVRFPSALAAFFTCLAVFFFMKKHFGKWHGLVSVLFLVTTTGYIRPHMARTADLDSVLVFFITCYSLLFFDYLISDENKKNVRTIYVIGALTACAFLSKSIAGLMPILGLFIGAILLGKSRFILSDKHIYFSGIMSVSIAISYYLFREWLAPGYLEKVWVSEYQRFTEDNIPWLNGPWWYYPVAMYKKLYLYYIYLLPLLPLLYFTENKKTRQVSVLAFSFFLAYVLLISYPSVKLDWYLGPIYPVLAILLGCLFFEILYLIKKRVGARGLNWKYMVPGMLLVFGFPYFSIYKQNTKYLPTDMLERDGYAIKKLHKKNPEIKSYKIYMPVKYPRHVDAAEFYIKSLNHWKGHDLELVKNTDDISPGDTVLCSRLKYEKELKKEFKLSEIKKIYHSKLMLVNGNK